MGLHVFQFVVLGLRGPHCGRYTWFGYEGGVEWRKSVVDERKRAVDVENESENEKGEDEGEREERKDEKRVKKGNENGNETSSEKRSPELMDEKKDASQVV